MKAKKSLGQNFLTSEAAVYKTVTAARIAVGDTVLEVGPGKGVLTKALLQAGANVVAVEMDHELIDSLKEKFAEEVKNGQLTIIEKDILETTPAELGFEPGKYKIVANLPYYITGQFLRMFLSDTHFPNTIVVLLQKEVVERIIAADKKESILSISIKAYGEPKKITTVNRGSFQPAPNVDSAVIAIEHVSKKFFDTITEETFFAVVKAGFAHKRKILLSNLTAVTEREKIEKAFLDLGISENVRAEDLVVTDWKKITEKLF